MKQKPSSTFTIFVGESRFPFGQLVITPGALEKLSAKEIQLGLNRHATGDWGELPEEDVRENQRALAHGARLFSAYRSEDGQTRFYVITAVQRSTGRTRPCYCLKNTEGSIRGTRSVAGEAARLANEQGGCDVTLHI